MIQTKEQREAALLGHGPLTGLPLNHDLGRNIKYYQVSPRVVVDLLTAGEHRYTIEGMPDDAEFITAHYDATCMCYTVVIRSKTFDTIQPGHAIPQLTGVTITDLRGTQ